MRLPNIDNILNGFEGCRYLKDLYNLSLLLLSLPPGTLTSLVAIVFITVALYTNVMSQTAFVFNLLLLLILF